jgi:hypothetical protein
VTVFSRGGGHTVLTGAFEEIDQSIAIVVEAAQNLNRAIFLLKSKAKRFDGSSAGL